MDQNNPPLPIDEVLPDVTAALAAGSFAVLVAEPGAGKTTRVPLALLDQPWLGGQRIIMLEPRRLATRAAARRMAEILDEVVGATVGYRVRLDSKVGPNTRIEVVTEGIFTRMLLDDPELSGIGAVIFDEFHERSLDADLGLALALDATELRPELRLLVMSATIDAAAIAKLLNGAPVIASEGRTFPVDTRYLPPDSDAGLEAHLAATILQALREESGSVLAFLPGQGEIRRTADRLGNRLPADVELAPLYGDLGAREQDRAIAPAPPGRRKVVLATAIAQTSLTIEGVRIVIDSGLARLPEYEPATGLTRLVTRRVSRAAADQRRGRAGRIEPGICYRLWHEGQTASLPPFDPPEMLAADITSLVLDLANWGVSDPAQLAFLDPPPTPAWNEAVALLRQLDALDASGRITPEGKALARLPLHPRLAHMVQRGAAEGEAGLAADIAVLLTERGLGGDDVDLEHRLRRFRTERGARADEARRLASRWAKLAGGTGEGQGPIGPHLARAYPDRVAQAAGRPGRFRLANGRQSQLEESNALAREPFLVVADLTGTAGNSRIRAAAAISQSEIESLFATQIIGETTLQFDRSARAVRARQVRRLGQLLLADRPVPVDDAAAGAQMLAAAVAEIGVGSLPWSREQLALRNRVTYLHNSVGAPWPDLSDRALAADVQDWLAPALLGRTSLGEVSTDDLAGALDHLLPWALRSQLDNLLPTHFTAPTGNRHPIDYEAEGGPTLAIRVQELFGLDRHPAIAGGKIPLVVVLLSPAQRPIQTTRDLPGFWRGSWAEVARDLKGRYPRHPWPEDALGAEATSRAKPRKA